MTKEFVKARIKYLLREGIDQRVALALTNSLHSAFGLCYPLTEGCEKVVIKEYPIIREVLTIIQTHDWPKAQLNGVQMNGFWMNAWMHAYHPEHLYSAKPPDSLRRACYSAWAEWAKATLKKIDAELLQD